MQESNENDDRRQQSNDVGEGSRESDTKRTDNRREGSLPVADRPQATPLPPVVHRKTIQVEITPLDDDKAENRANQYVTGAAEGNEVNAVRRTQKPKQRSMLLQVPIEAIESGDFRGDTGLKPTTSVLTTFTVGAFSNRSPPAEEIVEGRWKGMTESYIRNKDRIDYFFTIMRFSMGYSAIWRFPYFCYKYGGSFLVSYTILFPIMALPLYTLDHCLGQYAGLVPLAAFKHIVPAFQGLGVAMTLIAAALTVYFNILASYTFVYLLNSFKRVAPWDTCNRTQAGPDCWDPELNQKCLEHGSQHVVWWNRQCHDAQTFCASNVNVCYSGKRCTKLPMQPFNNTHCLNASAVGQTTPDGGLQHIPLSKAVPWIMSHEDYFRRTLLVMRGHTSWANMGSINISVILGLATAWAIIFFAYVLNIPQRVGKLEYVSTLACGSVFVVTSILSVMRPGATTGLAVLFTVKPELFLVPKMWLEVAGEIAILFGLGTSKAFGLASERMFYNNYLRDAIISGVVTFFIPFLFTIMAYSVAGMTAEQTGRSVEDAILTPVGLSFISSTTMSSSSAFPGFHGPVLFISFLLLGFTTIFSLMEIILRNMLHLRVDIRSKVCGFTFCYCALCFLLGVPFCLNGGIFLLILIDNYIALAAVLPVLLVEVLVVAYIYTTEQMFSDTLEMVGKLKTPMKMYFLITWKYAAPIALLILVILALVFPIVESFGAYTFPRATVAAKYIMFGLVLLCILGGLIWALISARGLQDSRKVIFYPTDDWCPSYKRDWIMPPIRRRGSPVGTLTTAPTVEDQIPVRVRVRFADVDDDDEMMYENDLENADYHLEGHDVDGTPPQPGRLPARRTPSFFQQ